MPVIPATQETDAGELLEPGSKGYSEPRLHHCTTAWVKERKRKLKSVMGSSISRQHCIKYLIGIMKKQEIYNRNPYE